MESAISSRVPETHVFEVTTEISPDEFTAPHTPVVGTAIEPKLDCAGLAPLQPELNNIIADKAETKITKAALFCMYTP